MIQIFLLFTVFALQYFKSDQNIKKLNEKDFSLINVQYLKETQFSPQLAKSFENHSVFLDEEYIQNKIYYDDLLKEYSDILDKDTFEYKNQFYGQIINNEISLISEQQIPQNYFIGVMTGIITDKVKLSSFNLLYQSKFENKNLYLDINSYSNIFRFAKVQTKGNCEAVQIPHNNIWKVMLISSQVINPGEEIIIDVDMDQEFQNINHLEFINLSYQLKNQKLQNIDFHKLGLKFLQDTQIDEDVEELLKNHKILEDHLYLSNPDYFNELIYKYKLFYENLDTDKYLYFKYVSEDIGYGVFAKEKILAGTMLGEYTGVIKKSHHNKNYAWAYLSQPQQQALILSAEKEGNLLRFVNDYQNHNVKSVPVPTVYGWKILYQATQDIQKDEELSISYGKDYWRSRELNQQYKQTNQQQIHQDL